MKRLLGFIGIIFFVLVFVNSIGVNTVASQSSDLKVSKRDISIKDKTVYVEDEILVTFQKGFQNLEGELAGKFGLVKVERKLYPELFTVYKTGDSKKEVQSLMEEIKSTPGVASVERNAYVYAFGVPNDPYYSFQWHMNRINMEEAWDYSQGEGVTVAVIDSGVKQALEDLGNTAFVAGYDFINDDNDPTDDNGHGSHVAGTIAQSTNNSIGVAGVAYKAKIMPVKVLDNNGNGNTLFTTLGVMWAADHGADVINLSLGGAGFSQALKNAVDYACNNGVVVVCAAGNDGVSTPFYPAAFDNSISVSATDFADGLAWYSNYGSTIDIAAPGGDMNADLNGDGYGDGVLQQTIENGQDAYMFYHGTSMAAPHVTGVVAMMKSVNSWLTNSQVKSTLYSAATDIGAPGKDNQFGYGLLNAKKTLETLNKPPVASFTTQPVNGFKDLNIQMIDTSNDPDGYIVSWHWEYMGHTSNQQNPVYKFPACISALIKLTVTDNEGAKATATGGVTLPCPQFYSASLEVSKLSAGGTSTVTCKVNVENDLGQKLKGANVEVTWERLGQSYITSVVTDSNGSGVVKKYFPVHPPCTVKLRVTNLTYSGMGQPSLFNPVTEIDIP